MARKEKIKGVCAICGNEENMTREHIPPESTGNTGYIKLIDFTSLISNTNGNYGQIYQNGIVYQTLCESCNNNTGHWYGKDYSDWVNQIKEINKKENLNNGVLKETNIKFYPLRVFKQIISMFMSVNNNFFDEDILETIKKFLLEKENRNFPKDFHLYFYVVSSKTPYLKQVPFPLSHVMDLSNNNICYNFSEIAWGDIGLIFSKNKNVPEFKNNLVDIMFFLDYEYTSQENLDFVFPVFSVNPYGTTKFIKEEDN